MHPRRTRGQPLHPIYPPTIKQLIGGSLEQRYGNHEARIPRRIPAPVEPPRPQVVTIVLTDDLVIGGRESDR